MTDAHLATFTLAAILVVSALVLAGAWWVARRREAELEARRARTDHRVAILRAATLTGVPASLIEERVARTGDDPLALAARIAEEHRLAFVWAVADARVRLIAAHPDLAYLLEPNEPPRRDAPRG